MKKILLLAITIFGLAQVTLGQTIPSNVPTNGLVGWWPFNGNANDASGNGNNGTVDGATLIKDRNSNSNSAYRFDGINDFIQCSKTGPLGQTNFTISFWLSTSMKVNTTSNEGLGMIIGYGKESNGAGIQISVNGSAHNNGCSQGLTLDNFGSALVKTAVFNDTWDFYTIVNDLKLGKNVLTQEMYKNGILMSKNCWTSNDNGITDIKSDFPIRIGKVFGNGSGKLYFLEGSLDDIGIWNRALTSSEIKDLYIGCKLSISTEPINQSSSINNQAWFTSLASDTTASYQWQSNSSSMGWANVPSNSVYSGVTTKRLKVSNLQVNNHKQLFRVIAIKNTCKDTSVVAVLTVNDTCITSTRDTLYIKVNTSSVNNPIYNTLKVYPNPSSTHVIIDNGNYNTMGAYKAKIVNTAGQQVFQSFINQQQFTIDAKTLGGAGVYTLYITDALNKVVGVKKIVLQ
jgi:hypothetical protein